jgi:hypothetical protein
MKTLKKLCVSMGILFSRSSLKSLKRLLQTTNNNNQQLTEYQGLLGKTAKK